MLCSKVAVAEFRKLDSYTDRNDAALRHQFHVGLSEGLKDKVARVGVPGSLNDLIRYAIQLNRRLAGNIEQRVPPNMGIATGVVSSCTSSACQCTLMEWPSDAEPMQLGLIPSPLTSEERLHRRQSNLCLYCGEAGHYLQNSPVRPSKFKSASPTCFANCSVGLTSAHITLSLSLQTSRKNIQVPAIIDSEACSCFMDTNFFSAAPDFLAT